MLEEVKESKTEEVKETDEEEQKRKEDMRKDRCPHCLQLVSTYPYVMSHPIMGWIECAACGIVFSPMSLRALKLKRAKSNIILPHEI